MNIKPHKIKAFTPLEMTHPNARQSPKGDLSLTGFTLVEIMIAVGIIGLLAAIAIPNFNNARLAARKSICINNMRQIDS